MRGLCFVLSLMTFQNINSTEHDDTVRVLTDFFARRHVQTVTSYTCWSCDVDKKLLEDLTAKDISASFRLALPVQQETHDTWYRRAFLVDLSCDWPTNVFEQGLEATIFCFCLAHVQHSNLDVPFVNPTDQPNNMKRLLKTDFNLLEYLLEIDQASNLRLFNVQNDWILLSRNRVVDDGNGTISLALKTFQTYFDDAYVLPDSGVFFFQEIGDGQWEIWSGFRASKSDALRVFKIGTTSPGHLNISGQREERQDFRGITLKANTIVNKDNFFGFHKKISADLDIFSHMHYEITVTLSKQLNFKIDLSVNNEYGWSIGNGTLSGLMGALQRGEIDMSAAGVLMRAERLKVADFTIVTMPHRTTALFRQPLLSSVQNILLLPFSFELWLILLANMFVFVFGILFLTNMNNRFEKKSEIQPNIREIVQLVLGAICQQALNFKSNLASTRVVIFLLFLSSLFIFTSYSASISALIRSNSDSIRSVRDIVELPLTFSAQISPYSKYYFEESDDPLIKMLYKTKMLPKGNQAFTKATVGVERIRNEFHGFMVDVTSAYKIIGDRWLEEEKCRLSEIPLFKDLSIAIPLVKKSGHKDIFKQKLIHQMEAGLIKRAVGQWIAPKPSCSTSSKHKLYTSVSIKDIFIIIKVFVYGIGISLGILVLEVAYDYQTKYLTNKKIKVNNRFPTNRFLPKNTLWP